MQWRYELFADKAVDLWSNETTVDYHIDMQSYQ